MKKSIAVFSQIQNKYLSFQGVINEDEKESEWTIVFDDNKNGLTNTISKEHLGQMLLELSGFDSTNEVQPTTIPIQPMLLLIILGTCDVIMQNRYPQGWFTAASVVNSFRNDNMKKTEKIASNVSLVAEDLIDTVLDYDSVENYLNELVQQGILEYEEMEGIYLYKFIEEYDNILEIFKSISFKTACFQITDTNSYDLLYFITSNSRTWCFKLGNDAASIELMDKVGIFETIEKLI